MAHRDSSHHEIELLMSFNYLKLFKPNEHILEKPNDENFFLQN